MKTLATALVVAILSFAAPANAVRVSPDYVPRDLCKNVAGMQDRLLFAHGYWKFDVSTKRPNDCVPGYRSTGPRR